MTKSKIMTAILIGGMTFGGLAFADGSAKPWIENPEQFAPDELSAYGEDYSRLHTKQDVAQAGPTLIAAGDGKSRPWFENPEAYTPDALSAYGGDYRLPKRAPDRLEQSLTIAVR